MPFLFGSLVKFIFGPESLEFEDLKGSRIPQHQLTLFSSLFFTLLFHLLLSLLLLLLLLFLLLFRSNLHLLRNSVQDPALDRW